MRRIPAVLSVLSLSAVALVGCAAPGDASSCERVASDSTALDLIDVTGATGAAKVEVMPPVYVDGTVFEDLEVGDGPRVTTRTQDVQFTATIVDGESGEPLLPATPTSVTSIENWTEFYPGFATMLECATEGSRIAGVLAPGDLDEAAATNLGLTEGQSAVVVLDLEKVFLPAADGAPVFNDRRGMPTVVLAPDGRPGVIVPASDPPAELAVEVLKKGDGEEITAETTPRLHYTGVLWDDHSVFDSTWESGASVSMDLAMAVPGFAQALEGQTVGSQILVVIPPELGYGEAGNGTIPGDATLVFVVDILGVEQSATQ